MRRKGKAIYETISFEEEQTMALIGVEITLSQAEEVIREAVERMGHIL